ncbi:MAG TPA: cupredoxin domain-containing protein, partial [Gaiellales bacterium]|nr:cupredoxin domain-containing protein [Gaiellales bacterium]
MRRRALAATLATLVLAAGAWVGLASSATAASTVNVGLRSFSISKSVSSVPHGKVTFHITNHAAITHNFRIRVGKTGVVLARSVNLGPGRSTNVTVKLSARRYTIFCGIH